AEFALLCLLSVLRNSQSAQQSGNRWLGGGVVVMMGVCLK
ncbi:unnamed protein product, partial [marine sediment metagenome]